MQASPVLPEINSYLNQIRTTPLVEVSLGGRKPGIWRKLEYLNPSGSPKDRIALHILEKAWRRGLICSGSPRLPGPDGAVFLSQGL